MLCELCGEPGAMRVPADANTAAEWACVGCMRELEADDFDAHAGERECCVSGCSECLEMRGWV